MKTDIIVDLQYGDCGKGKVTHSLLSNGNYTHCIRYNGGCNAGHTIYHNGKKFITHHIPAGVFYGVKSIIGSGCVINVDQFFKELNELKSGGINIDNNLIKIAYNTHVITPSHLEDDGKDKKIGTTKRGNGPAYRDKYARVGDRACDVFELKDFIIDLYEELYSDEDLVVLMEGAQGFGLDIDWGDYPYVTSSHCTVGSALLNGVPFNSIRSVFGVAKPYETYVGAKHFEPNDDKDDFNNIRKIGFEFGATTGRPRQINWLNLDFLIKAAKINGVTNLIINKMDVLQTLGKFKLYKSGILYDYSFEDFKSEIKNCLKGTIIRFSYSADKI